MVPIEQQAKKTIVMYLSITDGKGSYPLRRATLLANTLKTEAEIIFLHDPETLAPTTDFTCYEIEGPSSLIQLVTRLQPDLLIRDSGSSYKDEMAKLQELVPSILHFDDFGEGGQQADWVIQTLYTDTHEPLPNHYIAGFETFMVDSSLHSFRQAGLKDKPFSHSPHLVISFGDEDPGNLTYRAMRHIKQLQIPLAVSVVIGPNYVHDVSEIQLMALSRRKTKVLRAPEDRLALFAQADMILCDAAYTPYEVATIGVPCIVLAQNEFESNLGFPTESNGFTHLGLGRKVTQSNLLNAIMEPLLHEARKERAIKRQLKLQVGSEEEKVLEVIRYLLEFPKRKPAGYVTLRENRR
ncbi:CMP-N-acetylneuraminic acid synthetase [Sporosarcina sp. GW1-11]|uniref:CMP-N-acetylneuraminic acid synthetase n=1 Tax=Sporosarcina sp. GW1-11 TaxID=2899126 RepID=UPI00294D8BF8|nr:CMP-N-acetylneuraminic acid synthetase [Sporosarcina sp. GW1-11]MDV6379347.1 CMP-N-acetylneuraminic acid synthetase [Sporosarcina sp. GW1-11]